MKKFLSTILLISLTACVFAGPNLLNKEQYSANSITDLSFELSSEDLEIKETYDTSSIEVEIYCNYKKYAPSVYVSGSTLYIESARKGLSYFSDPTGLSCTVIVYIPQKKDFRDISIKITSGDIDIDRSLSAKDRIRLETTSGDINAESGLFADEIVISSTSGDIELYNIDADNFKTNTTSGDIEIEKFTGGSGSVQSTSGDIKLEDFATEYANFESLSGGISVKKLDCDYFDAKSSSGGITLELINEPIATSSAECSSSDLSIYLPMRAKFTVEASCSSGSFRDKFNNNRMNPRDNYRMDYNGGGATIKLRTSSGDITLDY